MLQSFYEVTKNLLCRLTKHKFATLMPTGPMRWLCATCDSPVYAGPVSTQGKAQGRQKYANRHKKEDGK